MSTGLPQSLRVERARRVRGFSLLELLVVAALALALAAMALPSWRSLLDRWTLRTQAQALVEDLRYARTQAIARAHPVCLCLSADGSRCVAEGEGASGWLVFLDGDANRLLGSGETLLRQHRTDSPPLLIRSNVARAALTYQANGLARAAAQTLTLGLGAAGGMQRLICVSMQGRAALQAEGVASCG